MDYNSHVILARCRETGLFDPKCRVDSCRVIGTCVETSLKLAYRPQVGHMVIPLAVQSPLNLTTVVFKDVKLAREHRVMKRLAVLASPDDAASALRIVTESMKRLQGHPYHLEVCATDKRFCIELGSVFLDLGFLNSASYQGC